MAQLQELLKEEQEPFLLKSYISDRRSQIKRPSPTTTLQLKKRKPLHPHHHHHHHHHHNSTSFPVNLCKNACLFSSFSTATTKSPLFELASPPTPPPRCGSRSPCKSPIFLHIPSRTAALLLEAALRIQKSSKTKPQGKSGNGLGLFGSFFKRLTSRKRETESNNVSVKDVLRLGSPVGRRKVLYNNGSKKELVKRVSQREKERENNNNNNNNNNNDIVRNASVCEVGFRCSYNGSANSVVWSESNEDNKSLDLETSSSTNSCTHSYDGDDDSDDEIADFVMKNQRHQTTDCSCFHHDDNNAFCESPFRFVLQRTPSSGRNTPELASPAPSPTRHRTQDKESSNGAESLNKFQTGQEEEEEEDKEQCSPVSVLDPPFEDDDEGHGNDQDDDDDHEEEDGFDLECSYAIVQRAKQQLLYKLRRFEKLAGLDPVELEKTMLDEEEDEDDTFMEEDDYEDQEDSEEVSCKENDFRELVFEALCQSSVNDRLQVPDLGLKKLVSDLIVEERRELNSLEDRDIVVRKVCKRLELWKEVESNTIDMMIEDDFSREDVGWKKNAEQMRDMAVELELAIFGFLVEEFSEELDC